MVGSYDIKQAVELFIALFALYSPFAALPSYLPTLGRLEQNEHTRLAVALLVNVVVISLVFLWVGEYLLVLLGISTAALSATGGIALMYEAVILMLGLHPPSHDAPAEAGTAGAGSKTSWRNVAFLPVTFPLTIGGATVGLIIAFSAEAHNATGRLILSIAALAYGLVTGITMYLSSRLQPRLSARALELFDRVAGILLTAIAAILLTSGGTRLVVGVLDSIHG